METMKLPAAPALSGVVTGVLAYVAYPLDFFPSLISGVFAAPKE